MNYVYEMESEGNGMKTEIENEGIEIVSLKLVTNRILIECLVELSVEGKTTLDNFMVRKGFVYKEMVI